MGCVPTVSAAMSSADKIDVPTRLSADGSVASAVDRLSTTVRSSGAVTSSIDSRNPRAGCAGLLVEDPLQRGDDVLRGQRRAVVEGHALAQGEGQLGAVLVVGPLGRQPWLHGQVWGERGQRVEDELEGVDRLEGRGQLRVEVVDVSRAADDDGLRRRFRRRRRPGCTAPCRPDDGRGGEHDRRSHTCRVPHDRTPSPSRRLV